INAKLSDRYIKYNVENILNFIGYILENVATRPPLCFTVRMASGEHPSARRLLADNLRLVRVMRRLSQTTLAEEAGVTQALVSAIERARANPTLDSLERLALVLGVRIGEFFQESEGRE